ncbi:acyltransferase [Tistrella mobilis]|uniref:acyltransferase family protein n=1 Tax=Tistrella mobilis TaxID=171437 RepID=UPI003559185F
MSRGKNSNIQVIELARGIAALMVAFYHLSGYKQLTISHYVDLGKIGVYLFFFVSGYLIVDSSAGRSVRDFVLGRFFRLFPLYWISVIFVILVLPQSFDYLTILMNFTMFQQFFGFDIVQAVYWTLTIEMVFYITIIMAIVLFRSRMLHFLWLYFGASVVLALALTWVMVTKWEGAPVAIGMGLATMYLAAIIKRYGLSAPLSLGALAVYAVTGVVTSYYGYGSNGTVEFLRYLLTYSIAVAMALVIYACRERYQGRFTMYGELSYGLYLFHVPVFYFLALIVDGLEYGPVAWVVTSILTLAICYVLHRWVEKPCIRMGKKFTQRRPAAVTAM